ncbi:MAG: hypothetical protein ACXWQO_08655 [Bdellovibrionota bacterium]
MFKIGSRIDPGLIFSHAKFALGDETLKTIRRCDSPSGKLSAETTYENALLSIQWEWTSDYVHCVASDQRWVGEVETLNEDKEMASVLSALEEQSVHSQASREVRLLAKRLLSENHSLNKPEIVRRRDASRFLPPELLIEGSQVPGIDLSLSHDGRFVAAVVSV